MQEIAGIGFLVIVEIQPSGFIADKDAFGVLGLRLL